MKCAHCLAKSGKFIFEEFENGPAKWVIPNVLLVGQKPCNSYFIDAKCGHSVADDLFCFRHNFKNSVSHLEHRLSMRRRCCVVMLLNIRWNSASHYKILTEKTAARKGFSLTDKVSSIAIHPEFNIEAHNSTRRTP